MQHGCAHLIFRENFSQWENGFVRSPRSAHHWQYAVTGGIRKPLLPVLLLLLEVLHLLIIDLAQFRPKYGEAQNHIEDTDCQRRKCVGAEAYKNEFCIKRHGWS